MKNIILQIVNNGIGNHEAPRTILQIQMVNIICFVAILISMFYAVAFIIDVYIDKSLLFFSVAIFMLGVFHLTKKGHLELAKISILLILNALIFYTLVKVGFRSQAQSLVVLFIAFSFILFNGIKIPMLNLICSIILFIGSYYYVSTYGPIDDTRVYYGEFLNFIFAMCAAALMSYVIILKASNYIEKIEKSLKRNQIANRQLLEKNNQIEKQNENLELFTSVASHDLKTPLRNISSFIGLIRKQQDKNSLKTEEYLDFAQKSIGQMAELVESITYLNKLDYAEEEEVSKIDLNNVVEQITQNFNANLYPELNIQHDELPIIFGKRSHFTNLFTNFIENGWKYNTNEEKKIHISFEKIESQFVIHFKDNGIGVDECYSDKIFDPFIRLHSNTEYEGTGLGLFICQKIVKLYNGTIEIHTNECEGSTFSITFPQNILHRDSVTKPKALTAI